MNIYTDDDTCEKRYKTRIVHNEFKKDIEIDSDHSIKNSSIDSSDSLFSNHFNNYLGRTVRIYTTSCDATGHGFCGTIVEVNHYLIRILNATKKCFIDIPIDKITAFVHNDLNGK
jgi:hypothetical protein